MQKDSKVVVAGSRGLVGSAIVRALKLQGYAHVIGWDRTLVDMRDASAVEYQFQRDTPEYVFLAAAKVGGILANDANPVDFLQDNLAIQSNTIRSAWRNGVRKLLFLGSSCIYPKFAPQPIREDSLLSGPLEETNEAYAIAKIAGIKLAQAYRRQYGFNSISLMPTNLYGPGDNFDLDSSHVIPALIRKFHEAKQTGQSSVSVWGTGSPRREFLHVDDLADAAVFLMTKYDSPESINVGVGEDISIRDLARLIGDIVGFHGEVVLDTSKPDGTPRKLLDVSRLSALGWRATIPLRQGLEETYRWYQHQAESMKVSAR